jgi:hypothetical protein
MSMRQGAVPRRAGALAALVLAALAAAGPAAAQERLLGLRAVSAGPYFETWSLDDFVQPEVSGGSTQIKSVSQLSVPVTAMVPIGARFSVDVSGGFAAGTVKLSAADAAGKDEYSLSGLTDTKLRLTGRLAGDNVIFTLGVNAPTGQTDLDAEEYAAARVLAAPALGFRAPVLGNGTAVTAGLVGARQLGGLSVALGASYEVRTTYSPLGVVAGFSGTNLDYNPSDAARISLMADGLVGQGQMRAGLSMDVFTEGDISAGDAGGASGAVDNTLKLGPVFTGEWHWQTQWSRFRALGVSVVDRYRTKYERDGASVASSDANYLDVSLQGMLPVAPRLDLVLGLNGRHQTGLDSDDTIAAAAFAGGGVTVGLSRQMAGGLLLQPMVRAQFGRLESAGVSSNATGLGAGITLSRRF